MHLHSVYFREGPRYERGNSAHVSQSRRATKIAAKGFASQISWANKWAMISVEVRLETLGQAVGASFFFCQEFNASLNRCNLLFPQAALDSGRWSAECGVIKTCAELGHVPRLRCLVIPCAGGDRIIDFADVLAGRPAEIVRQSCAPVLRNA